ncbi:GNAT family N-acetyltransferase [Bifidobacterium aemilianum]|uniref:GNAT family N-acetyltransferase n=1 Tax=Bifidobacterium aemilianum TaxID=2493120 RepID=UPI0022AAF54B|nr:GNAT family N-acetyltransferase [Bifidobacterium aemilianum]
MDGQHPVPDPIPTKAGPLEYRLYDHLPQGARDIRTAVFMEEQGFRVEFDQTDDSCWHLLAFDKNQAVGTCRFYPTSHDQAKDFTIGRVAIVKDHRGQGIGASIINHAEQAIANLGGRVIRLHAQEQAMGFYHKLGYLAQGPRDYDEDCPHRWMVKELTPASHPQANVNLTHTGARALTAKD